MSRMLGLGGFRRRFWMVGIGLVLVCQLDKNVFEAGRERANFSDRGAVSGKLQAKVLEVKMIVYQRVNGLAENCRAADSFDLAGAGQGASDFRSGDFDTNGTRRL